MGKASRRKRERRELTQANLDEPYAKFRQRQMSVLKRARLDQFKRYTAGLDVPPGESVQIAPMPTRRDVLREIDKELMR